MLSYRNGVYDLKTGTFRKSSSLDYLIMAIDYELPKKADKEILDEINKFIDSIMPNEEEKQYLIKWLGSCLSGFNKDEIFTILTDGEDDAIWDRYRIIDFVFKFADNVKGPFEKKIDCHLKDEVKTWGPQFMLILLDYYKQYEKEDGLHPSTAVAAKVR
ncbi:hypothetical protein BDK51DRAFT_32695 [Blyttiomyces helicus]|uniref:Uncharacterized protein n=1 Tax=Blyttiomyces helicus TaxID=388810 RepID=A0A4P9WRK1_9FUNG|nr:hypothetical protein BDK51DRAFT_32695 [Blyttiomyces helicus]|eukprot:RKO94813.1 hypothetical protein BDK51DRAFT_32695 [Blyttiomyces helicus]